MRRLAIATLAGLPLALAAAPALAKNTRASEVVPQSHSQGKGKEQREVSRSMRQALAHASEIAKMHANKNSGISDG